jgi:hypothetical protein
LILIVNAMLGCNSRSAPAAAYRNWRDRLAVATGLRDLGLVWPCTHHVRDRPGDISVSTPDNECFKFDPPKRWKGLWLSEFEGSRFCPEPAAQCREDRRGDYIWLGFARRIAMPGRIENGVPGTYPMNALRFVAG